MTDDADFVRIAKLKEPDLTQIAGLEARIFPDPWSLKSLQATFDLRTSLMLGAWQGMELAGYVIFTQIPPEGEILRIAVAEPIRQKGVAVRLLDALWQICEKAGITRVMLEVRSGNTPAVNLYEKTGFIRDGVRKGYYRDPADDALLMSRQI